MLPLRVLSRSQSQPRSPQPLHAVPLPLFYNTTRKNAPPLFSIVCALFSIHNAVYLQHFLRVAHSLRKAPGVGGSVSSAQHVFCNSRSNSHGIILFRKHPGGGGCGTEHATASRCADTTSNYVANYSFTGLTPWHTAPLSKPNSRRNPQSQRLNPPPPSATAARFSTPSAAGAITNPRWTP